MTGEVLLDEALKMMKVSERMSIGSWVDLMSGASICPMLETAQRLEGKATWRTPSLALQPQASEKQTTRLTLALLPH